VIRFQKKLLNLKEHPIPSLGLPVVLHRKSFCVIGLRRQDDGKRPCAFDSRHTLSAHVMLSVAKHPVIFHQLQDITGSFTFVQDDGERPCVPASRHAFPTPVMLSVAKHPVIFHRQDFTGSFTLKGFRMTEKGHAFPILVMLSVTKHPVIFQNYSGVVTLRDSQSSNPSQMHSVN